MAQFMQPCWLPSALFKALLSQDEEKLSFALITPAPNHINWFWFDFSLGLLDNSETTFSQLSYLWDNVETRLRQHWDSFGTTCDYLVAVDRAHLCAVGNIRPFSYPNQAVLTCFQKTTLVLGVKKVKLNDSWQKVILYEKCSCWLWPLSLKP